MVKLQVRPDDIGDGLHQALLHQRMRPGLAVALQFVDRYQEALFIRVRFHQLLAPRTAPALAVGGEVLDDVVEFLAEGRDFVRAEDLLQAQVAVLIEECHVVSGQLLRLGDHEVHRVWLLSLAIVCDSLECGRCWESLFLLSCGDGMPLSRRTNRSPRRGSMLPQEERSRAGN